MTSPAPDPYRRNERAQRAILAAAIDLAVELGYEGVSIEGIAKRAGVGKQTIYRWWPSKGAVLVEALDEGLMPVVEFPHTSDVVADIRSELVRINEFLGTAIGTVYLGFLAAAQSDPALAQSHLHQMVKPGVERFRRRLAVAREHGEIRVDVNDDALIDMLFGALIRRVLVYSRPLDPGQIDASLKIVFEGVREPSTGVNRPAAR